MPSFRDTDPYCYGGRCRPKNPFLKKNSLVIRNTTSDKSPQVPSKIRLYLSRYIYNKLTISGKYITHNSIIKDIINLFSSRNNFIEGLSDLTYNKFKSKIFNEDYKNQINCYLNDLIYITKNLIKSNESYQEDFIPFVIIDFINNLISLNITLGLSKNSLRKYIGEIFDDLKSNFSDFEINRVIRQDGLFDDGVSK